MCVCSHRYIYIYIYAYKYIMGRTNHTHCTQHTSGLLSGDDCHAISRTDKYALQTLTVFEFIQGKFSYRAEF